MSEEHLRKKEVSHFVAPTFATTVNLVIRIVEARGIPRDHKDRGRNCVAVIEFPKNGTSGELSRFETCVVPNTTDPDWNQQITLTVHNLADSVTVTVFHRKEKSGLFGDDIKDEFLGAIRLRVQDLVTNTVKNGFIDEWVPLNNQDCKEKYRNKPVTGEIRVEAEMGGILNEQNAPGKEDDPTFPADLRKLKEIQHRLITYKVNLKSLYTILCEAVVLLDVSIPPGAELSRIKVKTLSWSLCKKSLFVLNQFGDLWTISDVFRKMKYLELVFKKYQEQTVHCRVVTAAYKTLYEGVWKRGTIWLPHYDVRTICEIMFLHIGSNRFCLNYLVTSRPT